MYRLYIWFLGVPEDRPTGPWWQHDFPSMVGVMLYLADASAFLQAYSIVPIEQVDHRELFIKPPPGAKIVNPNTYVRRSEKEEVV